ncbi:MAG TPA: hypothetical protein VH394_01600 [Thermoanaerobaculia bacterium]|jgi:hypothetical protein|nr:hypothetical protein [Thermoanaerobaculia bacterium]
MERERAREEDRDTTANLFDARDSKEREEDATRRFIWDLTDRLTKLGEKAFPWKSARDFYGSQMKRIAFSHDNTLALLHDAIRDLVGFGQRPDESRMKEFHSSHLGDPLLQLMEATSRNDGSISRERAAELMARAHLLAERGSGLAAVLLGDAYERGLGGNPNLDAAAAWHLYGAAYGEELAINSVGRHFKEIGNTEAAKEWWSLGSDLGSPQSTLNLALQLTQEGRYAEARALRQRLRQWGNAAAKQIQLPARRQRGEVLEKQAPSVSGAAGIQKGIADTGSGDAAPGSLMPEGRLEYRHNCSPNNSGYIIVNGIPHSGGSGFRAPPFDDLRTLRLRWNVPLEITWWGGSKITKWLVTPEEITVEWHDFYRDNETAPLIDDVFKEHCMAGCDGDHCSGERLQEVMDP